MQRAGTWWASVAWLVILWVGWGAPARGEDAPDEFRACCIAPTLALLKAQDFPALEALYQEWAGGELLSDGRWKLSGMLFAFGQFYRSEEREARYEQLRRWRHAYPESPIAAVAEASYWNSFAWEARGSSTGEKVPQEAWPLFTSRLETSTRILDESRRFAAGNPLWYRVYLLNQLGLGIGPAERLRVFTSGIERFPRYYALYEVMGYTLVPKWGGSADAIEVFAQMAIYDKPIEEQGVIYAQIYRIVGQQAMGNENIFTATRASWKQMKFGFEVLAERHGRDAFNLNSYAIFACEAGDRSTFLRLYQELQGRIHRPIWPRGFSPEYCEQLFRKPAPAPRIDAGTAA